MTENAIPQPTFGDCLNQLADLIRRGGFNKVFNYTSIYEFVYRWGREFKQQPLPEPYQAGLRQRCFCNAAETALIYDNDLIYVEGYACIAEMPLPVMHAWNVMPGSDLVIDTTPNHFVHYFGVEFRTSYVVHHHMNSDQSSLLDDYLRGYPLLAMTDEELKAVLLEGNNGRETTTGIDENERGHSTTASAE